MKLIISLFLGVFSLFASDAFISAQNLKAKLHANNLVILDVTDSKTYAEGHVPGAILANVGDFRKSVKTYQLMKSSAEIQELARKLGINNNSEVVIYGHGKDKEILKSSYIALALITNGLSSVSLLDGGYDDWKFDFADLVSKVIPKIKTGTFTATFNPNILIDLEYVKSKIGLIPMLEARPADFYYGTIQSSGVDRLGHIPHAMSSYWKDKFEADETVREQAELDQIFIQGYDLDPNKEVILYCTGGLEASMNWYLLYKHMGFKNAKIYDGSMREWGNRTDTPIVRFKWEVL